MRKYLLLFIAVITVFITSAQDFSNKGKDFWVGYGYHQVMFGSPTGGAQEMVLYFATDQVTNITITIPGIGYTQSLTSPAGNNVLTSATIPKNPSGLDARLLTEGTLDKGIHITSDKPMVAYAHIYNQSVSGATILYPTNTLGKEYYSINYKNWSNSANANCWFYVVATDTGTSTIEITPTGNTTGGWVAGTTYTITLTQGQIYNVMGVLTGGGPPPGNNPYTSVDLTGSKIKSVSTGNGCKRIGVFSGSGRISITCNNNSSSSDNYMVQSVPKTAWGKKYLTAPAGGNQANNIYRVCVTNPATVVRINGVVTGLPLQNGFYYEIPVTNQPQMIEGDSSIMVAQYFTSQGSCGNGNPGDPEVIYLSAVEQNINTVLWNATPNFAIGSHWVNVVIPNGGTGVSSFTFDGVPWGGFIPHPQDANYSYLRLAIANGPHIIRSDSGFNAIAYGFGNAESYGYNAGTNIKDLYQQILVQTQYGIEQSPSVCTDAPFRFKISLPYCADSVQWDLSGLPGPPVPTFISQVFTTCVPGPGGPDSTTVVNGKTIYWYSLPTLYTFSTIGSFPVSIIAYNSANPDGCGNAQLIDFNLQITGPPTGDFTWIPGGCVAEPFRFVETTPQIPKATYSFYWNFGDPASGANNTSNLRNPTHTFTNPGVTYTVKYIAITTPGCFTDTVTHTVFVDSLPRGTISGTTTLCINSPQPNITFTGINGTPPYTFTYTINGGAPLTVNSPGSTTTATIPVPTNTAGVFIYELINVKDTGSILCTQNITGQIATITIEPDHTITLSSAPPTENQTVCINTPIIPITYTLGGGATGAVVTGLPAGVTSAVAGTTLTISGSPTTTTGSPFNYSITTTGNTCITASDNGTITVEPDHTITLSSAPPTTNQTVCINTAIIPITYTLGGGATGGTVTGLPAGVTSAVAGTTLTISGSPTTTVGSPFNYSITTTGNTCITASSIGTITVEPDHTITLSSAPATENQTVCINTPIIPITYTLGGGATGAVVTGLPAGVTSAVAGTTLTISGSPTTTAGSPFNYSITTTGNTCITASDNGTITVEPDHTITLSSAPPTTNQTVCINTAIIPITYTLGGGATGGTVTGLPAGVTSAVAGTTLTISGSPTTTVGSPFNYSITTTGNTCITASSIGTITVEPDHTITLNSGNNNQTVCINTAIVPITYTLGGGATGATIIGLPAGVVYAVAGTVLTISGSPTTTVGSPFAFDITTTGNSCINTFAAGSITVNPDHTISLNSGNANQAVCMNIAIVPITFTLGGGATGAIVTGLPAGITSAVAGNILTISGAPTTTAGSPFNYSIITTGNTCITASSAGTITVYQLPTPNFSYTVPSCETRTISFTDLSVANSGVLNSWTWDFGDGPPTSPLQNPTHVYAAAGIYNVSLSVGTDLGCVNTSPVIIAVTINDRPAAGYIIPEVCLSDTYAQFIDTSTLANATIDRWDWDFGDPGSGPLNTSTLQNPTHSYSAVGNYNVRLIVWNNAIGCRDTITQLLTVNGSFPVANFTVNNPTTLCANDSVAIVEASTVFPGVITRIEIYWDNVNFPAVFQIDNNPFPGKIYRHLYPNFQAPLTRIFTIRYRAYSGGVCVNDKISDITVNAAPLVQFNAMPDVCLLIPPFQITQASETGGVPGTGVYTGPGVSVTGLFTPAVAGIGTHTILYTFTSAVGGCMDTMSNTITVLDTAHAAFTYVSPICQTVPGSFTDVSTAPATVTLSNTVWDFGDGSPIENHAPGSTFGHLFPGPGTYTVTMYNVSAYGCNSTVTSQSVTVDPDHTISLNPGSNDNQTVCINTAIAPIIYTLGGGATNATVTGLPAGVSYVVAGTTLTISGTPNTTLLSPFNYSIVTTGNSCLVANANGSIAVNPDHTITLSSGGPSTNQAVCVNSAIAPITYTLGGGATGATVTGLPAGINYTVVGNTLTISGTPVVTAPFLFNYAISTTGNTCLTANAAGSITVNPFPVPMFAVDKPGYCIPNALINFNNTSTIENGTENAFTYLWNFGEPSSGGSNTSVAKNPSHWYSGTGPFNVNLRVTSGAGCVHDTTIVVNNIHPQPKADFSFNKPSNCIGDDVTLTDLSDGKDGIINQWNWDLGDGSIRTTNPVTYTYTDTITYNVILYTINTFGCNSDTITKSFTVYPYPYVNAGPDRFILEGGSIVIESVTFGNDAQYLWTPNLYLVDNKVARPRVIRPLTDMTYKLTVTARGGCALSDNVFVKLLKFPVIPNTFTPNNDGTNDTWRIDYLNTYPDNRVQVFTRTGQLVFESRGYNTPWDGTIKGKPLPFDTYYYIIEPGSGRDPITGYVTIIK